MTKTWVGRGSHADRKLVDELFRDVSPTVGHVLSTLAQLGRPHVLIAALFERAFDGKVSGGVRHRAELAQRVLSDPRFSEADRDDALAVLKDAGPDELPIILLVDRGEAIVAVGIRSERSRK